MDFHRPEGAVESEGIYAEALQNVDTGQRVCTGEGSAVLLISEGDEYRQARVFLDCKNRRLGFVGVGNGLNQDEVGPIFFTEEGLLLEECIGFVKGERPHGLHKLTQRSHVQCDIFWVCCPCMSNGVFKYLVHRVGCALQLKSVGTKGVGGCHICTCCYIFAMYRSDDFRVLDVQCFRQVSCLEPFDLEQTAHRPVKE